MILRPVRPASPTGPPMTKRPVGLTRKFVAQLARRRRGRSGRTGSTTCSQRSSGISDSAPSRVLGGDQQLLDLRPGGRRGSGRRPGSCRRGAGRRATSALRTSASRLASLCASEIGSGISSGVSSRRVAEHHALVAGAGDVELVVVGRVGARLVGGVDALGDVGRLLVDRVDDRAGVGGEAEVGVGVADLADRLARDRPGCRRRSSVEISPETTTRPVLTSVSQATRPVGSSRRTASRTPSEIWSATLSGWPSVTDSEVNRYSLSCELAHGISRNSSAVVSVAPRASTTRPGGADLAEVVTYRRIARRVVQARLLAQREELA